MIGVCARRFRRASAQQGVAAVEFAIAIPLLLFVMLVTAEFGRVLWQYSTLTHAARDAVRYLAKEAIRGSTSVIVIPSATVTETKNLVMYGTIGAGSLPIVPSLTAGHISITTSGGTDVLLTIDYPYVGIFGTSVPNLGFGSLSTTMTLRVVTRMRAMS